MKNHQDNGSERLYYAAVTIHRKVYEENYNFALDYCKLAYLALEDKYIQDIISKHVRQSCS